MLGTPALDAAVKVVKRWMRRGDDAPDAAEGGKEDEGLGREVSPQVALSGWISSSGYTPGQDVDRGCRTGINDVFRYIRPLQQIITVCAWDLIESALTLQNHMRKPSSSNNVAYTPPPAFAHASPKLAPFLSATIQPRLVEQSSSLVSPL